MIYDIRAQYEYFGNFSAGMREAERLAKKARGV
jgi:hypothetical protein